MLPAQGWAKSCSGVAVGLHDSWGGGACVSRAFGDIQGERWILRRPPAEGPGARAARGSGAAWSGQELTASGHTSLGPGRAGRLTMERPQPGRVGVSLPRRACRLGRWGSDVPAAPSLLLQLTWAGAAGFGQGAGPGDTWLPALLYLRPLVSWGGGKGRGQEGLAAPEPVGSDGALAWSPLGCVPLVAPRHRVLLGGC